MEGELELEDPFKPILSSFSIQEEVVLSLETPFEGVLGKANRKQDKKLARARANRKRDKNLLMANVGVGIAIGAVGAILYAIRPKDPIFQVNSLQLRGFKLRFSYDSPLPMAVIDLELTLSIKVINPNVVPIEYKSTVMDIYYGDSLLGQAQVSAGSQGAKSCEILEVPAKLDGLQAGQHFKELVRDIAKREMSLRAVVTINGSAWLWTWGHKFEMRVESNIKVDPLFLDVIEQENKVHLKL